MMGKQMTLALMRDISEQYHALAAEEKEYWVELGADATRAARDGARPFGPRRRRGEPRRAAAPADPGEGLAMVPAGGHVPPDPAAGLVGDGAIVEQARRPQQAAVVPFLAEASRLRSEALAQRRRLRAEESLVAAEVAKRGREDALVACDNWPVLGRHREGSQLVAVGGTQSTVLAHHVDVGAHEVDGQVVRKQKPLAAAFRAAHVGVIDETLTKLPAEPPKRRLCHEAGRCVCRGEGRQHLFVACKVQDMFANMKRLVADFGKLLAGADLVVRLSVAMFGPVTNEQSKLGLL